MRLWLALLLLAAPARAADLYLLTRDGVLHEVKDGTARAVERGFVEPRAMAVLSDGRIAIAHAGKLELVTAGHRRMVPGRWDDLRELAASGTALYATTETGGLVEIDLARGRRSARGAWKVVGHVTADERGPIVDHDGLFDGAAGRFPVAGHPIALAAASGHLFWATREGPLWQLDLASGRRRDLGLGGWWGTLALAASGTHLYVVTESGKLWDIDYARGTKTALAMDGWQGALALSVVRR